MSKAARPAASAPPRVGIVVNNVGGYSRAVIRGAASFGFARNWTCRAQGVNARDMLSDLTQFDGLIVQAGLTELRGLLANCPVPVVNVSSAPTAYPAPSVVSDDVQVGRLGADHLLARGHRRLIFYRPDNRQFVELRQSGFTRRAGESGVRVERAATLAELDDCLAGPRPVAILGCNDRAALAALDRVEALGLACPDEVAVLGVDNDDLVQGLARPPMSTINTARERIGYEAAALLGRIIDGEAVADDFVTLVAPHGVIARQSTDSAAVPDPAAADAARFLRANAARRIGIDDVADHVAMSRRQIERRFRAAFGRSLHDELHRCRIERSRRLLVETDLTIGQVADASGFSSASYFTTSFRRSTGESPGQFRDSRLFGIVGTDPSEERPRST